MENKLFFISVLAMLCMPVTGSFAEDPVQVFEDYQKHHYRETVFLQPDKNYYFTGEPIRFKVYCLDRMTGQPSELSKVAYVELLDRANVPVMQAKIPLTHGSGFGEIYLSTNIASENYVLRSYTRWMRNDGPESYFHSILPIINPFKKAQLMPKPKPEEIKIALYPESGALVDQLSTRVVMRSTDIHGNTVAVRGKLVVNDTLVDQAVSTDKHGLGSFTLSPKMDDHYRLEILLPDSSKVIQTLPPVKSRGAALQVTPSDHGFLINIFSNDAAVINPAERHEILIWQKGKLVMRRDLVLQNGRASFQIGQQDIEDGIFNIGVFNPAGKEVLERKIFNSAKAGAVLHAGSGKYGLREQVELNSSLIDSLKSFDFSVSIADRIPGREIEPLRMDHYLLLDHALEPYVYGLEGIFEGNFSEVTRRMNDLLITVGDQPTEWEKLAEKENKFVPEFRGPVVSGMIKDVTTGEPADGIMTYLSIPGKNIHFFATKSKKDGSLLFEMHDFYNSKEIVVQNDYTRDTTYRVEIDNPFSDQYAGIEVPVFDLDERLGEWITQKSRQVQIANAYKKYQPHPAAIISRDTSSFYNEPDARYYLDDYTRFVVMEEVMREYIAGINVRKNRNGFHFMTVDVARNIVYEDNPLMLLDGVPVFDADDIMALDPLKIEKIETVKQRFHMGYLDCQGVVTYTSYLGDMAGYTLPDRAKIFQYPGLQLPRAIYHATYEHEKDKKTTVPDYRSALYWAPAGMEADDIYTSDEPGEFDIQISGIDKKGQIFIANGHIGVD